MSDRKTKAYIDAINQLKKLVPVAKLEPLEAVRQIRCSFGSETLWFLPSQNKARSKKQLWQDCDVNRFANLIIEMMERQTNKISK